MGGAIGKIHTQFLEKRGISVETAGRYEIYAGRWDNDNDRVVADINGEILVFPSIERDVVVNEKYRRPGKKFSQKKGGKKVFWNVGILDDPRLAQDGGPALIITEGEMDALTAIEAGFETTVSVPDGAPPPKDPDRQDDTPIEAEATGKFEFMWSARDQLKRVKRFILAVDTDAPGKQLEQELLRRLGAARCAFLTYPEGCKDLNDVLMKHGRAAVAACISGATPYPVAGLYHLRDFPAFDLQSFDCGFDFMADVWRPYPGGLCVVTGIPGHGKSTFLNQLALNMHRLHGWRTAIFSPEMPVVPMLRDALRRQILRRNPLDDEDRNRADTTIDDAFTFISEDPGGSFDMDLTLEWVLERADDAVYRDGIRMLIVDPWNEIEHARDMRESSVDYIGRGLRTVKRWARRRGVYVIIAAHPTKQVAEGGKVRPVTPYDIEGAAHWFNKADHVVILDRDDEAGVTTVRTSKVKFQGTGTKAATKMKFDLDSERFYPLDWKAS